MSDQLKNRLVGAVVLITLAVIFLPDILDGQKQSHTQDFKTIPLRPNFETSAMTVADSQPAGDNQQGTLPVETGEVVEETVAVVEEPVNTPADETPPAVAKTVEKTPAKAPQKSPAKTKFNSNAWVVRMGGFNNADNVKALVAKLRKEGFKCYTLPSVPKNGSLTRVFVGPNLDRKALEKQLPKLKALTALSGSIVKYEPTAS